MEKGRNCSPGAIFPLFHNIYNLILDFCVITRTRFSVRDKRLFEITEVEITRVDCSFHLLHRSSVCFPVCLFFVVVVFFFLSFEP